MRSGEYSWLTGFMLHLITGGMATAAHYGVMWLSLQAGLTSLVATSIGFIFGAVTRFFLSYFHVFSSEVAIPMAMGRFIVALLVQLACNGLLLNEIHKFIPIWEAQVVTTISLTVFTYIAHRVWVFR